MRYVAIVLLGFILTGCSGFFTSKEDVKYFYLLNPLENQITLNKHASIHFKISKPILPDWLDTQRIVLYRTPNQIDFYHGARWASRLEKIVDEAITQSLVNNGLAYSNFKEFKNQTVWTLSTEVLAFNAVYQNMNTPPTIQIKLQVKVTSPSGEVKSFYTIDSITQAQKNTLSAIVSAFQEGLDDVMQELVLRTSSFV